MPALQLINAAPGEPAAMSPGRGQTLSLEPETSMILFAVRADKALDTVETLKTALPQGSLLCAGPSGAWRPVETATETRASLSVRQLEILRLLGSRMSNKEIGRTLGLSHFTVRNHISQLLRLFNVPSRGAAAALWGGADL